jgi:hypothetical protein
MGNLNTIETGHLPKLEREMINFALDNGDVLGSVEMAVLNSDAIDECLEVIAEGFRMMFEDEVQNEMENLIDGEDTESASDYADGYIEYHLADCFQVNVTREVEQTEEPDFETCAVRALAA